MSPGLAASAVVLLQPDVRLCCQLGWVAGPGPSAKGSESTRATAYCPVGAVSHS